MFEAEEDAAAREQPKVRALAESRGNGRDATVNFFAADADVNATVLRQPAFGDVHVCHDFDARGDSGLKAFQLRRHRGLVQRTVHAIPDAQIVFHRIEVNVGRAFLERFPDDLVDELDDARLLVAAFEIFFRDRDRRIEVEDVFWEQFVERFGVDAIVTFERLGDVGFGTERELHAAFYDEPDGLDHHKVERVIGGDEQITVLGAHRHDVVLKHNLGRHFLARSGFDFFFGDAGAIEVQDLRERGEQFLLRDRPGFPERGDERFAGRAWGGEQFTDLRLSQQPDLAEQIT